MSTFKNGVPENQIVLMNTVRTIRIFTVRLLYLNDHYIFPFPHSKGAGKVESALWKSRTTGRSVKRNSVKVKNLPDSAKDLLKQMSNITMMLSQENKGWCMFLRDSELTIKWKSWKKALLVPNFLQFAQMYFWFSKQWLYWNVRWAEECFMLALWMIRLSFVICLRSMGWGVHLSLKAILICMYSQWSLSKVLFKSNVQTKNMKKQGKRITLHNYSCPGRMVIS